MADKDKGEKEVCGIEEKIEDDEITDTHPDGEKPTDSCQDTSCESTKEQATEHSTNTDSTSSEQFEEEGALKKFEIMFKNRFTDLDPGYIPYKSSNDAEAIPIVENFPPPWNSQNRRGGFHGRGHGSRQHHQHNRGYKRRHEEYRSNDNRQGRGSYHSNHQRERQNWQRQDHYYGHGQNEHFMHNDSRDQGYRRY